MLSPSDADLVRRDPALAGLATVLDAEALVAALRRSLPEACLGAAEITYLKYKPGTNCLVGYRLEVSGIAVEAYAKAYRLDVESKLRKAREQTGVRGPLGSGR